MQRWLTRRARPPVSPCSVRPERNARSCSSSRSSPTSAWWDSPRPESPASSRRSREPSRKSPIIPSPPWCRIWAWSSRGRRPTPLRTCLASSRGPRWARALASTSCATSSVAGPSSTSSTAPPTSPVATLSPTSTSSRGSLLPMVAWRIVHVWWCSTKLTSRTPLTWPTSSSTMSPSVAGRSSASRRSRERGSAPSSSPWPIWSRRLARMSPNPSRRGSSSGPGPRRRVRPSPSSVRATVRAASCGV